MKTKKTFLALALSVALLFPSLAFGDPGYFGLNKLPDNLIVLDDKWIGLGAAKCREVFNDTTADELQILDCLVQVGAASGAALLNLTPQSAIAAFYILQAYNADGIKIIISASTSGHGIRIDTDSTNALGLNIESSKYGAQIIQDIVDGYALLVKRNLGATDNTNPLVEFHNQHVDNIMSTFFANHDGTGGATGFAGHFDSENLAAPAVLIESVYTTSMKVDAPRIAGDDGRLQASLKVVLQGTGALTNGTTNTKVSYMDDSPAGEWTSADADFTESNNSFYYKVGSNSLKIAIVDAASAGDIITSLTTTSENWSGRESNGFWVYVDTALSAGDIDLRITDGTQGDTDTDVPAVSADIWTWVEVDISGVADADKDDVDAIKFIYTVDKGAMNIYFDFFAKWDSDDETALNEDILKDGMMGVMANPVASGTAMAWVAQTEYTDYFINYAAAGNGNLVVVTDESANSFVMQYAYE